MEKAIKIKLTPKEKVLNSLTRTIAKLDKLVARKEKLNKPKNGKKPATTPPTKKSGKAEKQDQRQYNGTIFATWHYDW